MKAFSFILSEYLKKRIKVFREKRFDDTYEIMDHLLTIMTYINHSSLKLCVDFKNFVNSNTNWMLKAMVFHNIALNWRHMRFIKYADSVK